MDDMIFSFKVETPPAWIPIGRTAENDWRTIEIDCSYWFNMNANGEVVLMYKPSCGMSPYPLLTERDGDNIIWRPKSGELVEGVGRLQAFFEVGTDVIGSSDMISCEVDSSLLGADPGTDPGQTDLPWALDIIEQIAELSGHYPKIIDGDLYIWDSTTNDWVEFEAGGSGGGAVESVNGKTGAVVLGASDVGALPDDTPIPAAVTEQTVSGWGFTKNTGTYSKPSGGIPASDLAAGVIPTVPQMATQPDMSDWTSGKTVDAAVLKADFITSVLAVDNLEVKKADKTDIPTAVSELTNDSNFQTAAQVQSAIAAAAELPSGGQNGQALVSDGQGGGVWGSRPFQLPSGGQSGQALLSDGSNGAFWGQAQGSGSGLTDSIKSALLACFRNVAWINDQGETFYQALYDALYPPVDLLSISAVFTQGSAVIYDTDSLDTLRQYLTVTATYDDSSTGVVTNYTLSGTLREGTSTITVAYGGKTTTFTCTVQSSPTSDMDGWTDGVAYTNLTIVSNSYSRKRDGEFISYEGWDRTDFVPCNGAATIVFPPMPILANENPESNNFYDENHARVSNFSLSKTLTVTITVPQTAYYFVISGETGVLQGCIGNGIVPHGE